MPSSVNMVKLLRAQRSVGSVFSAADEIPRPSTNIQFIVAFDIIHAIGLVSLAFILLTAWRSPQIRRNSTWAMFLGGWFITSLANLILLGQQSGLPPMTGVCLTQAMLLYALPVFSSFYATAFMLYMYMSISSVLTSKSSPISRKQMIMLHGVPCFSFFSIMVEVLVLGVLRPDTIQRNALGTYCHLTISTPVKITAGLTIAGMVAFLSLEVYIAFVLWRQWVSSGKRSLLRTQDYISIDVAVRLMIFSFCPIIAMAISALQYVPKVPIADTKTTLIQAVLPVIASLIFGTQRDILNVWMFWRKESPKSPINKV